MEDPYKILGVERGADDKAIRTAFKKLAKLHHPDLNPGKPDAEARFKDINAAYSILSDREKRARYDRGEIDASGAERPPERPFYRDFGDRAGSYRSAAGGAAGAGFDPEDLEEILRSFAGGAFGNGGFMGAGGGRGGNRSDAGPGGGRASAPRPGADAHYTITVDFLDAINGAKRRIALSDGRSLDLTIPAGTEDGHVLRLKGQGAPGSHGGRAGDALIEVAVAAHPFFRRDGNDIVVTLPITVKEAALGAKVTVPTVSGKVSLTVPANSSSGARLRLKGKGVAGGHQMVELQIVLPPGGDPALNAFLETWQPAAGFDPRRELEAL